jgi:hypothetical protein
MTFCDKLASGRCRWRIGGAAVGRWSIIAVATISSLGCGSRQSRIYAIAVDPQELSEQVFAEFDADGSGTLAATELSALPPVQESFPKYDADGNGQLTAAELCARFEKIFNPDVGVCPVRCQITRNGRPLQGAEVRFVPPKILADTLPAASGTTGSAGTVGLRLDPEDMPENIPSRRVAVMRPGIYLVQVTHPSLQIPPQYNAATTLGKEVFSEVLNGPPLQIRLSF